MTKKLLTVLLLAAITVRSFAQQPASQPLSDITVATDCDVIAKANLKFLGLPQQNLVSKYTFKNLLKNDFSTVTIADNTATVGQFAALSIDPNTYKLAFSPYAWSPTGDDLVNRDFKQVFAFNVTATLSNQSLLDLKDWRTVTGGFSWTFILKGTKYYFGKKSQEEKALIAPPPDYRDEYRQVYTAIANEMLAQLDQAYDPGTREVHNKLVALNHPEFLKEDDLKKAYLDSISHYEQMLTKDKWTAKQFIWLKLTGTPLSFDNANYIRTDLPTSFDNPLNETKWTPSANAAINYFRGWKGGFNFYFNANVSYGLKDMFSSIYTPETYNNFTQLTAVSAVQNKNEQIFQLSGPVTPRKLLPDFGSEVILIQTIKKVGLGADFNYMNNFIISNTPGISRGNISTISVGIIVGLQDKTGKSNINIEPYWQYQDYQNASVSAQHLYGVKFSIPINSLY